LSRAVSPWVISNWLTDIPNSLAKMASIPNRLGVQASVGRRLRLS
jgi:hypothetical protein